jgi:hypothetical protein
MAVSLYHPRRKCKGDGREKKLNFPLPWRQGMKGGGGDAVNFFYCLTAKYAIEGRIQPG